MIEAVKLALRINNNAFNEEIKNIINACKKDLSLAGVERIHYDDPLIQRAITLYAKANFGYSDDSDKFQRAYDMLKCSLSLAGDYNALE